MSIFIEILNKYYWIIYLPLFIPLGFNPLSILLFKNFFKIKIKIKTFK